MNALVPVEASNAQAYKASTDAAGLCKEIVVASAMEIQGRKYVKVEGWQAIAIAHGCTGSAREVERVEGGVRAIGEVRRMSDGVVIAEAEGFVGEDEPTWFGGETTTKWGKKILPKRPDYAIRAMAQTRAISRACRSAFAHVVVMMNAGLSTTPAEEVPLGGFDDGPGLVSEPKNITPDKPSRANPNSSASHKKAGTWEVLEGEIDACKTLEALEAWNLRRAPDIRALPTKWYDALLERYEARQEALAIAEDAPNPEAEAMDEAFRQTVGAGGGSAASVSGRNGQVEAA